MRYAWLIVFSLLPAAAHASSCCVANAGLPQFITLPAQWQVTAQLSEAHVIADTSPKGRTVFRASDNRERTRTLGTGLAFAHGPWQYHASFAYAQKERRLGEREASSEGVSDPSVAIVRELPSPKAGHRLWAFGRHVFATADSIYDDTATLATNAFGTGRPQSGLGMLYLWNGRFWDFQVIGEAHHGYATTRRKARLDEQQGASLGAGGGWVTGKWRLGGMLTVRFESASRVEQDGNSSATDRIQVWDSTLSLGRQLTAFQNVALSYNDQTWVGPARNTTLSRTLALLWQWRW